MIPFLSQSSSAHPISVGSNKVYQTDSLPSRVETFGAMLPVLFTVRSPNDAFPVKKPSAVRSAQCRGAVGVFVTIGPYAGLNPDSGFGARPSSSNMEMGLPSA